ncbi:polyprotein [Phytophthora megakarya]|uniref:Polyprotein n=1 Tax=Phytophthora megakarya TaxID=4795 RepID=A0A225VGD3_9STRA|nr:polyprotein [Phytophthora megakarya]
MSSTLWVLGAFRIYCLDQPVMIETDHKSLEGVFQQKMANRRLARWCNILAEYQPVFAYLPGAQIGIANDLISKIKPTNDLVKVSSRGTQRISYPRSSTYNQETQHTIGQPRVSEKQYKQYFEEKNMVWYQGPTDAYSRIPVPNIVPLKHHIIADVHDSNYDGHPGADRTYLKLRADWYWHRMTRTIKKYIADCEDCQRNNPRHTKTPGMMEPLKIPDER